MELNADFSRRVAVHGARLDWVSSPVASVERRMLDRVGDEVARATSIVRYAPQSRFPAHTHGGGEELFILDGSFEDEHGAFPAGSYIRNPPASRHAPGSTAGCILFVKLWQFDPQDRRHLVCDTGAMAYRPTSGRPGVEVMPLYRGGGEEVRLERWHPAAAIALAVPGGAEFLVLDGGFDDGAEGFAPLSWLRLPPAANLRARAGENGCRCWVKTGHLAHIEGLRRSSPERGRRSSTPADLIRP